MFLKIGDKCINIDRISGYTISHALQADLIRDVIVDGHRFFFHFCEGVALLRFLQDRRLIAAMRNLDQGRYSDSILKDFNTGVYPLSLDPMVEKVRAEYEAKRDEAYRLIRAIDATSSAEPPTANAE